MGKCFPLLEFTCLGWGTRIQVMLVGSSLHRGEMWAAAGFREDCSQSLVQFCRAVVLPGHPAPPVHHPQHGAAGFFREVGLLGSYLGDPPLVQEVPPVYREMSSLQCDCSGSFSSPLLPPVLCLAPQGTP